LKVNFTFC